VVDDYRPFRQFISSILQKQPNLQVVGEVEDGLEAITQAQVLQPDLILLDIGLPGLNGIEVARRIAKMTPHVRIVFLTQESSAEVVEEALRLGARGYVTKVDAGNELLAAVEAVLGGARFVGSRLNENREPSP